jgi:hypothetical protein
MRSVLELTPTTNFGMANGTAQSDTMESLAAKLKGFLHPVQLVGRATEVDDSAWDWPTKPRLRRTWYAVAQARDQTQLAWRQENLIKHLESIGLRCTPLDPPEVDLGVRHTPDAALCQDGYWASSLVLKLWPRQVAPGWLGHALAGDNPIDVGIHFLPQDPRRFARFLKRQHVWQAEANANKPDALAELGAKDAARVRMDTVARADRPCKVAIVFTVKSREPGKPLKEALENARHEIGMTLSEARPVTMEQDRGLQATGLSGECHLTGAWRTLDCTSVASTWMYQPGVIHHANGADLGVSNGMLVKLDPFDDSLESFGAVVIAKVGMGKSLLMKRVARSLSHIETWIVEQRYPPEYAEAVPSAHVVSLAGLKSDAERATKLREFLNTLWDRAAVDPKPRLLILDELWSLIGASETRSLVNEIARIGRHRWLSLWIATQQAKDLLRDGQAVLDNCAIKIFLKQHDNDIEALSDAAGLSIPQRRYLRSAARGQALLTVADMTIPVDIQTSKEELKLLTTDPREKARLMARA